MKRLQKFSTKTKFLLLVLIFAPSFLISLAIGSANADLASLMHTLFNLTDGSVLARILLHVRIPRILAATLCGAALATSGALLQAALHNSLAAPNIVGVNSGAGVGVLIILAFAPSYASFVPLAAFLGALFACALVYLIAKKTGASRLTLVLAGVATSSF